MKRSTPLAPIAAVTVLIVLGGWLSVDASGATHDGTAAFMPHGMCFLWDPRMLALHVGSDAVSAAAYFSVPAFLVYFARMRRDIPFGWIFWMFGAFIVACGFTHVLDILTIWKPVYWLSGSVKAVTALLSVLTAALLIPLIPKALQFRTPLQLMQDNARYLQFLTAASERLAMSRTLQSTLDTLSEIVVPDLADCIIVSLIDDAGILRVAAVRSRTNDPGKHADFIGNCYIKPDAAGACGAAVATGRTQIVATIDEAYVRKTVEERYHQFFLDLQPRSAVAVPLRDAGQAFGTLTILRASAEKSAFNEAEVRLCEALTERAVVAIANARHLDELEHAAYHDALTGLANRAVLSTRLTSAIERSQTVATTFAVLFVDIDRFKLVNDSLGHIVGDHLLRAIARRLEICVRAADTLARISGDEFAILMSDIAGQAEATAVAERILLELVHPFRFDEHEIFVTASIGVAIDVGSYDNPEEVMRDADIAMYRAKTLGKQRFALFEPLMRDQARKRLQLETELRHAANRSEIEVYYQPIVMLANGAIVGFEALARWNHPTRGIVSPSEFIPVAEDTGQIIELGALVLRAACAQLQLWLLAYPDRLHPTMSVNVSAKQLAEPGFVHLVRTVIEEAGIDAQLLHLEITESAIMKEQAAAVGVLVELRALGVRIDVDDFGTGYSSLAYLHTFPLDTLKIDRSFVSGDEGRSNPDIIRTILSLASSLRLQVVAEGVETAAQEMLLRNAGCGSVQGYRYAWPMPAQRVTAYLDAESGKRTPLTWPPR